MEKVVNVAHNISVPQTWRRESELGIKELTVFQMTKCDKEFFFCVENIQMLDQVKEGKNPLDLHQLEIS